MVNAKIHCPPIGQVLQQHYELIRLLGSGAFGDTYVARDLRRGDGKGTPCLIKHFQSHQGYPHLLKTSRRIFVTEAEMLKKLGIHDQIPRFIDCFEENEQFYLVQELVVGQPLSEELSLLRHANWRDREAEVIYFLRDLLQVLDFVHAQGIIHCDVKPNNILRRAKDGRLVLVDFGTAQPIRSPERDRELIGTLPLKPAVAVSPSGYLATEQLLGKPYANSDIYATGIIAIQILTGIDPAKLQLDLETNEINWQHIQTRCQSHSKLNRALTAILQQMVRYNHQQRYQSAQEVLRALEPLLEPARRSLLRASEPAQLPTEPAARAPSALLPSAPERQATPAAQRAKLGDGAADRVVPGIPAVPSDASDRDFQDWHDWQEEAANPDQPDEPPAAPAVKRQHQLGAWKVSPVLMATLTRAGIFVAILNAFALGFGIYTLANSRATDPGERRLAKANKALQRGDLDGALALANSVPEESPARAASQAAVAEWQQDWNRATQEVSAAEQAFAREEWAAVLAAAADVPEIEYWQQKLAPLLKTARERAEAESTELLSKASGEAYQRNFTQALEYLRQIPPSTEIGAKIQPKIEEYARKEDIRAMYFLQQAYDRAEQGEFKQAIAELDRIPSHTPAGKIASQKRTEYIEKQRVRQQAAGTVNWSPPTDNSTNSTNSTPAATPRAALAEPIPEPLDEPGSSSEPFIEVPGDQSSLLNPGSQLREAAVLPV